MQSNVKILLVDDNPMVLGLLRDALEPLAKVTTAGDGADALVKAVEETPDLLVSDYRMPGMDGRQLVEKLKSRSSTSAVSVVLLATKSDISEKLALQDHPADELRPLPSGRPDRRAGARPSRADPHHPGRLRSGYGAVLAHHLRGRRVRPAAEEGCVKLGIVYHMPFWRDEHGALREIEGSFARYVDALVKEVYLGEEFTLA